MHFNKSINLMNLPLNFHVNIPHKWLYSWTPTQMKQQFLSLKKEASITSPTVRKHMYTVHLIKSWENVLPMLIAFYYKSLSHSLNELRFPIKCRK